MTKKYSNMTTNGRVYYVEPNALNYDVEEDGITDNHEFIKNPEDYCIAVDLQVEVVGRTKSGRGSKGSNTYIMSWDASKLESGNSISFLSGTKLNKNSSSSYLTTSFTDLTYEDAKDGLNNEMFGITSIDIDFDSYFTPVVTINFVDVKGVSLMSPEEYAHDTPDSSRKESTAGSFFKCFFTFPYPKFTLKVKGLYGDAVTYQLTCSDFRATFDSKTGNFGAVAKMIGYNYSLLSDVPFRLLKAAPYSTYVGREYWINNVNNGRFRIDKTKTMPTLLEIEQQIARADAKIEQLSGESEVVKENVSLNARKESIEKIYRLYQEYYNTIRDNVVGNTSIGGKIITDINSTNIDYSQMLILTKKNISLGHQANDDTYGIIDRDRRKNLINLIKDYNKEYNSQLPYPNKDDSENMPEYNTYQIFEIPEDINTPCKLVNNNILIEKGANNTIINTVDSFLQMTKNESKETRNNGRSKLASYGFLFSDNGLIEIAENELKAVTTLLVNNTIKYNEFQLEAMEKAFAFLPTVENIMKIIFAHLETLLHCIYSCANTINADNNRTVNRIGITLENTDMDVISTDNKVPPFPQYIDKAKPSRDSNVSESSDVYTDAWIGNLPYNMEEVNLIAGLSKSISIMANLEGKINEALNQLSNISTTIPYPTSINDLISTNSPYPSVTMSSDDVTDVIGHVALRMMKALGVARNDNSINKQQDICKFLGKVEAYNLFSTYSIFGEKFYQSISGFNNGDDLYEMLKANLPAQIKDERYAWDYSWLKQGKHQPLLKDNDKFVWLNEWMTNDGKKVTNSVIPISPGTFEGYNNELFNKDKVVEIPVSTLNKFYTCNDNNIGTEEDKNDIINENVIKIDENVNNIESLKTQVANLQVDGKPCSDLVIKWNFYLTGEYGNAFYRKYYDSSYSIVTRKFGFDETILPYEGNRIMPLLLRDNSNIKENIFSKTDFSDDFEEMEVGYYDSIKESTRIKTLERQEETYEEMINNGSNKLSNLNSYTIPSFYSYENDSKQITSSTKRCSLYGLDFFYAQNENDKSDVALKSKAILFLHSLPLKYDLFMEELKNLDTEYGQIIPKGVLLFIGGLLWRERYYKQNNTDCFIFKPKSNTSFSYKDTGKDGYKKLLTFSNRYELCPIYSNSGNDYIDIDRSDLSGIFELRTSIKNYLIDYFLNWVDSSYIRYNRQLELMSIDNKPLNSNEFRAIVNGWKVLYGNGKKLFNGEYPEAFLKRTFNENFVENYISIDLSDNGKSFVLYNRESSATINEVTSFVMQPVGLILSGWRNFENSSHLNSELIMVNKNYVKNYLSSFLETIKKLYENQQSEEAKNRAKSNDGAILTYNEDMNIALYLYLKTLYDRWLSGNDEKTYSLEDFFNQQFHFIDSFYRKIGKELVINMNYFAQKLLDITEENSLLSVISDILANNGMTFLAVHNFADWSKPDLMEKMFKPIPFSQMTNKDSHPDFLCMYSHEPSKNLNIPGSGFRNDAFCIDGSTKLLPVLANTKETYGYNIPAFGVAFGKQYQSYFKNININMANPISTEQSIKSMYIIADKGKKGPQVLSFTGQDLYTIFSNNSYTCEVTMMGCAQVQPMMYFQLLNIEMFSGTYIITKVKHNIVPGNMTTHITGVRLARSAKPFNQNILNKKIDSDETGTYMMNNLGRSTNNSEGNFISHYVYTENQVKEGGKYSDIDYHNIRPHLRGLFDALRDTIRQDNLGFDIMISSGLRTDNSDSDHYYGCAMDIIPTNVDKSRYKSPDGKEPLAYVFDIMLSTYHEYIRQMIWECSSQESTSLSYPNNCLHIASYGYGLKSNNRATAIEEGINDKREIFQSCQGLPGKTASNGWGSINYVNGNQGGSVNLSRAFLTSVAKKYLPSSLTNDEIKKEVISMLGCPNDDVRGELSKYWTLDYVSKNETDYNGKLLLLDKVKNCPNKEAFQKSVESIAKMCDFNPNWLMMVMYCESGLDPNKTNKSGSAVGLIQFTQIACDQIKTTKSDLLKMNANQQILQVAKYFNTRTLKNRDYRRPVDVYLAIFKNAVIGQSYDTIIYQYPSDAYKANSGMDRNKDNKITIKDVEDFMNYRLATV